MKELSWDAEAIGDKYCAPACGRGCTVKEHREAVELADKLVALLGPGWKPVVWENLGWHYRATKGLITVYETRVDSSFVALLARTPDQQFGRWHGHGKTPKAAINVVIQKAINEISGLLQIVEEAVDIRDSEPVGPVHDRLPRP